MPTSIQLQNITAALAQIRSAEQSLDDVISKTADENKLKALATIYDHLTSTANTLIKMQTISDDAIFAKVTSALRAQANVLKADEALIQHIVTDAGKAGKIAGYLVQAATLIAKL
jgi:vacuolar-type H+-ATPase subunit H